MSTEYTSKSNHIEILEHLKSRLGNYDTDLGTLEHKLDVFLSTVGLPSPYFFSVNRTGDLYVYFDDSYGPPSLEYDKETGDLYWIFFLADDEDPWKPANHY